MVQQDIDPMAFPPTNEQFGITCIPGTIRLDCDFGGPMAISSEDASLPSTIYPTQLHLSKLKGKCNDVYTYLAAAQQTKFAVTPLHTKEEFTLYNKTVSCGGEGWCPQAGKPVFHKLATWWSSKADGKTIFYKLPEHLLAYHKKWTEGRNWSQSMVASEPQRQPHILHIQSGHHTAQVLDPASRDHPGIVLVPQTRSLQIIAQNEPDSIQFGRIPPIATSSSHQHHLPEGQGQGVASMDQQVNPLNNLLGVSFKSPKISMDQSQIAT